MVRLKRSTEEAITRSLTDVRDTRAKFQALAEAQERKAEAASIHVDV